MPTRANQMETELLLAWAAGFIDGEGCISVTESTKAGDRNRQFQSVITASQVNRLPLDKLQELLGGSVRPVRQPDYHGLCYVWRIYGDNVLCAARLLVPFAIAKKRQLELVIEFQTTKGNRWEQVPLEVHARRAAIHAELRELNSKRIKRLDAERLSEETPKRRVGRPRKGDAIVRTHENSNREKSPETSGSVH